MMRALTAGLLCFQVSTTCLAQEAKTSSVREAVRVSNCPATGVSDSLLNGRVATWASATAGDTCVVAWFESIRSNGGTPLDIMSINVKTGQAVHTRLPMPESAGGPIRAVRHARGLWWINILYSLDDYAIPILDDKLTLLGLVYGDVMSVWPNGLVLYHLHQPHFGPHWVRLGVFDTHSRTDTSFYPPAPCDRVRRAYVTRRFAARGVEPNPRADPCWIESESRSDITYSWATASLAFAVVFHDWYDANDRGIPDLEVMVTCQGIAHPGSLSCHEVPLQAWKQRFPKLGLAALVAKAAANPRLIAP